MFLLNLLIPWPKRVAEHFLWAGPLTARIIVGYTFMMTGWSKLQHLGQVTEYFTSLGIPFPHILTPLVAGWECFGGVMLMLGLLTRINGGALAVIMVVATISAHVTEIHSMGDLFGLEEVTFFAIFTWLTIAGAGKVSFDYLVEKRGHFDQWATTELH